MVDHVGNHVGKTRVQAAGNSGGTKNMQWIMNTQNGPNSPKNDPFLVCPS